MRGKNTRKRVQRLSQSSSESPASQVPPLSEHAEEDSPSAGHGREPRVRNNYIAVPEGAQGYTCVTFPWAFPSPVMMPPDMRLLEFPEVMDDKMRGLIFRCKFHSVHDFLLLPSLQDWVHANRLLVFTAIKETMYPVEWCFRPAVNANCWFHWLFQDVAYYYSVLFIASSFQDIWMASPKPGTVAPGTDLSRKLSPRSRHYLRRTIALLQKRLDDPALSLEDVSIATVVSLAMVADACGDTDSAKAHVGGLKQMVRMRGGVRAMMSNRHVLCKICRVDLGYSIKYGERPEFFDERLSWSPLIDRIIELESPVPPEPVGADIHHFITSNMDQRLQNIFCDLRAFSSVASRLVKSKSKLRPELFQEIMMSIQYRLLLLKYDASTISEALRIGLLTYQTSVFLQMHGTKIKYNFIADQLASAIRGLPESEPVLVQLKLWLVFIGSIVMLDSDEPWLMALIRRLTLNMSWAQTRDWLGEVMWIGPIHDVAGKQVYDGAQVAKDTVTMGLQRFWTEFLGSEAI